MKPTFDLILLKTANTNDKFPLECEKCGKIFLKKSVAIKRAISPSQAAQTINIPYSFCSKKCRDASRVTAIEVNCGNCNNVVQRTPSWLKKTKNSFCSRSCSATYNNLHKTTGTRRSKLEKWLEEKLYFLYPKLEILYCNKTVINAELDIYIPSIKLGFELNGIYHYEPIHGKIKLDQIQSNDNRKFQACLERNIELVIIDASTLKYFKEQNCQKYLDVITKIIDNKIVGTGGVEPPSLSKV